MKTILKVLLVVQLARVACGCFLKLSLWIFLISMDLEVQNGSQPSLRAFHPATGGNRIPLAVADHHRGFPRQGQPGESVAELARVGRRRAACSRTRKSLATLSGIGQSLATSATVSRQIPAFLAALARPISCGHGENVAALPRGAPSRRVALL